MIKIISFDQKRQFFGNEIDEFHKNGRFRFQILFYIEVQLASLRGHFFVRRPFLPFSIKNVIFTFIMNIFW